ncbi:hypothetical protein V8C26DRAFT_317952 [Trichoderma gracile]
MHLHIFHMGYLFLLLLSSSRLVYALPSCMHADCSASEQTVSSCPSLLVSVSSCVTPSNFLISSVPSCLSISSCPSLFSSFSAFSQIPPRRNILVPGSNEI